MQNDIAEIVHRVDLRERLSEARGAIRVVERFAYRLLSDAIEPEKIEEAKGLLRLAVGLRRKLDQLTN